MIVQNIVIPTQDFRRTVAFYRDALALPIAQEGEGFCFLRAGGVNIAIHPVTSDSPFAPTGHGFYLDIKVDDLAQVRERLAGAKAQVMREWVEAGVTFLAVADPNGNLLELYEDVPQSSGESSTAPV